MPFDFSSNPFFTFINNLAKTTEFLNIYRSAIFNQNETTYNAYIKYITYKTHQYKSVYINGNSVTQLKLFLINQSGKCMYNSYCNDGNYNSYARYTSSNILIDNINKCDINFILNRNGYVIGFMTAQTTEKNNEQNLNIQSSGLKKVVYIGYWMDYDQFNSFVNNAHEKGITHICLEFAELLGNLTSVTYTGGTVGAWASFSSSQRDNIINSMNSKNMKLLLSFGGANTFKENGAQSIFSSPTYSDPSVLAEELTNYCVSYRYHGIDLDIEHFPTTSTYNDIDKLAVYFGQLSQYIKQKSSNSLGYPVIVSHAPQSPYFNGPSDSSLSLYGYVYSRIEKMYGMYIDFYNIQYYNQGANYLDYCSIFTNDTSFKASVLQLIYGGDINPNYQYMDTSKIVVGKGSNLDESNGGGYIPLYVSPVSSSNCMAGLVEATKYDGNPNIVNWSSVGGVMVWYYDIQQNSTFENNKNVLDYFNYINVQL